MYYSVMKRMIIVALSFFFLFATAIPVISKENNRNTNNRGHSNYQKQHVDKRQSHDNNRNYNHHSRNYKYHNYNGRRYNYKGHYGSWNQWDSYRRQHPDVVRHGSYYREGGHLMFRFSDPIGNYFFFSIGR
jgi:hypothetical protein